MQARRGKKMYDNLHFRRQFLLSRTPIAELADWQFFPIAEYYLYAHPDLEVTFARDARKTLILLGCLFDPERHQLKNQGIVQHLLESTKKFPELRQALKTYPGRYALFCVYDDGLYIMQDALSLREVYYCRSANRVICGSQPNLLAKYAHPLIPKTTDPDILDFVHNHMPKVRNGRLWVGDATCYEGIYHLMPNHYLDIQSMVAQRYWPDRKLDYLDFDEAVDRSVKYLEGVFKAVTNRYNIMMAFNPGPVDDTVDFLHSDDGPFPIHRFEEGDVGEGEAGHFLEAHISSKVTKVKH